MAKPQPEPVIPKCPSCNGNGGEWTTGNGDTSKPKQWISCRVCNGTGQSR